MAKKYTYLEVRDKPWNTGKLVMRYDATGIDKATQEAMWREIESVLAPESHAMCTIKTNEKLDEYGRG